MNAVGKSFLSEKKYPDAWEWFSKAADRGDMKSIVSAALLSPLLATAAMKSQGMTQGNVGLMEKMIEYARTAQESAEVPSKTKEDIGKNLPTVLYCLCCSHYFLGNGREAVKYSFEKEADSNAACRVIRGLCFSTLALKSGGSPFLAQARPLLEEVDAANIQEAAVKFQAYMVLALIYRDAENLQIAHVKSDIGVSRDYVVKASMLGGEFGAAGKTEAASPDKQIELRPRAITFTFHSRFIRPRRIRLRLSETALPLEWFRPSERELFSAGIRESRYLRTRCMGVSFTAAHAGQRIFQNRAFRNPERKRSCPLRRSLRQRRCAILFPNIGERYKTISIAFWKDRMNK